MREQRLSFISTSTGYSSTRSSLRSSDIDVSYSRESSLSEARRLKILKFSNCNISQLDRIAMELLETERCYVNDLNDVIQGYLNFFVNHRDEFRMTIDDVSSTFGCIERIFLFNKCFYHQLDAALLNVVQMAKCFIDNASGFKDYVTYCTNYQRMIETLTEFMKNGAITETLALRQSVLGHSLPLSAYLLKPVQRILKYHLFMENILKHSVDNKNISDADIAVIRQAMDQMTAQAEKINEEKKRVEHYERVRELQNVLQRWGLDEKQDLSKYGDLLLEGLFKIAGSKTNRLLFLFEEMLLIVKERSGVLICKDYIMCSNLMLNESISSDPLAFQVLSFDNPKIHYIFLACNPEQKRRWMKELKRMMLDHYTVEIPERAKLLVLSVDNGPKQYNSPEESGSDINFKNRKKIPKYLEKRRKSIEASSITKRSNWSSTDLKNSNNKLLRAVKFLIKLIGMKFHSSIFVQ
ncbi:unnamed protein product [Dracunculus medinensis]|uniref:DH domain-containing protein n=1 Tax=Dracunculus medinensis TaxID=318479 RepID=A0A0N4U0I2_DRAME|nr:unnamed protein product [Dracunculus medinensis]